MRGTYAHRMDQVFVGGPDKPGHDDLLDDRATRALLTGPVTVGG
jgi:hypothetical protein